MRGEGTGEGTQETEVNEVLKMGWRNSRMNRLRMRGQ